MKEMENHSGYISFGKLGQFHPTTVMACFSLFYIAAWSSVVLIVFGDTLHIGDVITELMWGQEWLLLPPRHPPLPNWILNIFFQLGGRHSTAIIGHFFSGLTLFMVYLFARRFVAPHQALLSAALLVSLHYSWVGIYHNSWVGIYNHNTAQPIFWILVMYLFYACLQGRGLHYWCFLGAAAAACFLSKYSAVFLLICVPGWLLLDPQARKLLSTRGPWISLLVFLLLIAPHAAYFFLYDGSIKHLHRGQYNEWFILSQAVRNHSWMFFILGLTGFLWKGTFSWNRHLSRDNRFLLVFALLPFFLPLLAGSIIGQDFRFDWFWPCFLLSGLLVMRFLGGRATLKRCQWGIYACIALLLFDLGSTLVKRTAALELFPSKTRARTLLPPLAEKMDAIFAEHTKHIPHQRRIVVATNRGGQSLAKAVFMMAQPQPKLFLDASPHLSPMIDQKALCDATIIINSQYSEDAKKKGRFRRWQENFRRYMAGHNSRIEKIISDCVAQGVKPITFDFLVHYKKKLWTEKPYRPPFEVKLILLKK